jgi:hypothetical protein
MKAKLIILICALQAAFGQGSYAQYYIEQTDMLIIGTDIRVYFDTSGSPLNFGGWGTGLNWDFTSISSDAYFDNIITTPAGKYKANVFPTATTAVERPGLNTAYYENLSTHARFLGAVFTGIDSSVYLYNYIIMNYPSKYNDEFSDTGVQSKTQVIALGFDPDGPGPHPFVDSMTTFRQQYNYYHIDGFGSVKTPSGQYDAYRQFNKITNIDSSFMYANGSWQIISPTLSSMLSRPVAKVDTLFNYSWLTKGKSWPVAIIEFDLHNNNKILTAQYADVGPVGIAGNENESSIKLYPNPANAVVSVSGLPSNVAMVIYSTSGQQVQRVNLNKGPVSVIDVGALETGSYIVNFYDVSGTLLEMKTLVIE